MKTIANALLLLMLMVGIAQGEEGFIFNDIIDASGVGMSTGTTLAVSISMSPSWELSITEDGFLSINGKPVKEMEFEEARQTMKAIFDWIQQDRFKQSLIDHYDRQTGYLLKELEKCQEGK